MALLPKPGMYKDWSSWASKLVQTLSQVNPTAVLQLYSTPTSRRPNALPDGLFIYDSQTQQCLVSKAGAWVPILDVNSPIVPFPWVEVTGNTAQMQPNFGYIANSPARVQLTLPALAKFGAIVRIGGKGAGGWHLAQNAGQVIHHGNQTSTMGTGGFLESQNSFDTAELMCMTENSNWLLLSTQGNLTIN